MILRERYDQFIDGAALAPHSGTYYPSVNPADGKVLAQVSLGDARDADAAVESAERTFRSTWTQLAPVERGRRLMRLSALLLENREELATLETLDTGKPLGQAKSDVSIAARYFEYYGGVADKLEGSQIPLGRSHLSFTLHDPYGVVALIVPWNSPINQTARGLAPALAAGNAAVIKPAKETPLTALRLAELVVEAGFPPGLVNVVTGNGSVVGQALVEHPLVRMISFTGSVEVGKSIVRTAVERIVPVNLELGGKSANVIFADANMDAALMSVLWAVTRNAGQVCSAATRLLVQASVLQGFIAHLREALAEVNVGPGIDDPDLGPLVSQTQLDRVLEYVAIGRGEGASVTVGGERYLDSRLRSGFFMQPTVFQAVTPRMRIAQEEIFGPVVVVIPFADEDEAISIANETDYGLAAGVYTNDVGRAMRFARRLEAGQVFVNEYPAGGVETPFGGYKQSGWGREKGLEALRHYSQLKTVILRTDDQRDG